MIYPLLVFSDWGILILRVTLGIILIARGARGISRHNRKIFSFLEAAIGLLLTVGLFTQIAAFLLAARQVITVPRRASEVGFIVLAAAIAIMFLGGGNLSLDYFFRLRIL